MASEVDVAIVGGGPCGCAAALTLLRYTRRRVLVIERSRYESPRIGETVSPALGPLLSYLGVEGALNDEAHLPSYGAEAAWGQERLVSRDFVFTGRGMGWHLDRLAFDRRLVDAVTQAGGEVLLGQSSRSVVREGNVWRLRADETEIFAREVIDASGRSAAFARLVGARRRRLDRLVGLGARFEFEVSDDLENNVMIETASDGWWYSAPVPGRRMVVVFMTDADLLPPGAIKAWEALLAQTTHTRARCGAARRPEAPRIWPAESGWLEPALGAGWIAAGDAAMSFDPLSSLGVGHAIASGIQAARIVEARLKGSPAQASAYAADIASHRDAYLSQRAQLYAAESRFADAPFWRRRVGLSASH